MTIPAFPLCDLLLCEVALRYVARVRGSVVRVFLARNVIPEFYGQHQLSGDSQAFSACFQKLEWKSEVFAGFKKLFHLAVCWS